MAQDFVTRLAFLVFIISFLARKRDLKRAIAVVMICLVMVVPSALLGYAGGRAQAGYRAVAAFSAGTNPNRLAFLCVLQIAFWWYLIRAQTAAWRRAAGYAVIGGLVFTVFLTASRSGVIGLMIMFYLLARSRGGLRGGRLQLIGLALIAVAVVVTVIPQESLERLRNLNPLGRTTGVVGGGSTEKRVATVEVGWRVFRDYPLFGVGLGNFREVVRQVYLDPFWRPPHNSYLWALTEGGIACLLLYLALFAYTWRDIRWLRESTAVPHDLRWVPEAFAPGLIVLLFFSAFADIWLSPITYMLIGLVIAFKRYVSERRVVLV
jgi:O-antigen ligase